MNQNLIVFPCLALICWTFIVLLRMFSTRVSGVKSGEVDFRYFKTYNTGGNLPVKMIQAGRNFTNLFEVPTHFFAVCAFTLITQRVDQIMLTMAWAYVFLRVIHSLIHLSSNKIGPRMTAFAVSCMVLFSMTVRLGYLLLN